ncbi:ABC transporter permease, partial [Mesorhizobium sp. M7A.F.Ca.CA.001.09.1.1]
MRFRIEQRPEPSATMRVAAPVLASVLTLVVGSIFFASLGHDP